MVREIGNNISSIKVESWKSRTKQFGQIKIELHKVMSNSNWHIEVYSIQYGTLIESHKFVNTKDMYRNLDFIMTQLGNYGYARKKEEYYEMKYKELINFRRNNG